jgi:hypothetical protein
MWRMAGKGRDLELAGRIAEVTARAVNLEQVARPSGGARVRIEPTDGTRA